jgi:hypothetical protein
MDVFVSEADKVYAQTLVTVIVTAAIAILCPMVPWPIGQG